MSASTVFGAIASGVCALVFALAALRAESREDAVRAPNPWFFLERAFPRGEIPKDEWRRAQRDAEAMRAAARADNGFRAGWVARGPTNIGGRVTDLAVDPTDANRVFAATAEGGVLRSTDAGLHWTPLFDQEASLSIGAIALDPVDTDIVYAGTGEVNPGGGSVAYGGTGLYRSTDAGLTWEVLGLEETGSIGRVRVDPTDSDRIYVAAMGDLWDSGPDRGVYRSTDGGASFDRVLFVSDSTGAVDLILRPDQPQVLFAAMWERMRRPEAYDYGGATSGVYQSTDGGTTWSLVQGGLPAPSGAVGRIGLSLCAGQPATVHAVYADDIGFFSGLYRSTNAGANWIRTNDGALANVFSSYGWWFGNVRTHPTDPSRIFVVGFDTYRSTNAGASWSFVTSGVHVDHHALEFGAGANPVIYLGHDGGVHRSTNGGTGWTKLPDLPITQFYRVAIGPSEPVALLGGAQDNGTVRTLTGGLSDWSEILGGDGFQPLVHPLQPNRVWAEFQYGSLYYSTNGGGAFNSATAGIGGGDRHNWNTPVRLDPTDPNRMYYGTQRLYRSTNGSSWTAVSPDLTFGASGGGGQVAGTLSTIDVSPLDGNILWTGSDDGRVQRSTNFGVNWVDVTAGLPQRWITAVRAGPHAAATSYVTVSGFRWNESLPHVFRTTNLGASWSPISANLPEAPINDLISDPLDPERIFIASDVGVFETRDGGATWSALGASLPNVVVTSLVLDSPRRTLYAGTYGRSLFSLDLEDPAGADTDPTSPVSGASDAAFVSLRAVGPNPAVDRVNFFLDSRHAVGRTLQVVTASGRHIRSVPIADGVAAPLEWDLHDDDGRRVAAGRYFARLRARQEGTAREIVSAAAPLIVLAPRK